MFAHSLLLPVLMLAFASCTLSTINESNEPVREHAQAAFERLQAETVGRIAEDVRPEYEPAHYIVGIGMGDLSKGRMNCRKIALVVERTSGNEYYDLAALRAVRAAILPTFPPEMSQPYFDAHFSFAVGED